MNAEEFLETVVRPNVEAVVRHIDDYRSAVNSILTLDVFFGLLFCELKSASHPFVADLEQNEDDGFRNRIAQRSLTYRVLRDAAAALKHGELKRGKSRLLASSKAVASQPVSLHGTIRAILIEFKVDGTTTRRTAEYMISKGLAVARKALVNPDYKELF